MTWFENFFRDPPPNFSIFYAIDWRNWYFFATIRQNSSYIFAFLLIKFTISHRNLLIKFVALFHDRLSKFVIFFLEPLKKFLMFCVIVSLNSWNLFLFDLFDKIRDFFGDILTKFAIIYRDRLTVSLFFRDFYRFMNCFCGIAKKKRRGDFYENWKIFEASRQNHMMWKKVRGKIPQNIFQYARFSYFVHHLQNPVRYFKPCLQRKLCLPKSNSSNGSPGWHWMSHTKLAQLRK